MATYQDFKNTLLPGNYALTKSMELTKVQTSGTLWYTKKFLVLYYYVFLSREIQTREYVEKVIQHFDRYIETLDESIREDAYQYFYPENNAINFKSDTFKTFSSFAAHNDFANENERQKYLSRAKKNYFTLLMGSGGQKGVKKYVIEAIQTPDYVYNINSINAVLKTAAITSAVNEANVWIPTLDDGNANITEHILLSDEDVVKRIIAMSDCGENYIVYEEALSSCNVSQSSFQVIPPNEKKNLCGTVVFDSSERMDKICNDSVSVVITSPPYWNLKDYFKKGQIGQEPYEEYLKRMHSVWKECYTKLKDSGSLWININIRVHNKEVILIPKDFVTICKKLGFYYKGIFIWHKSSGIPTGNKNIVDRHEYVLIFSKSENFDLDKSIQNSFVDYKNENISGNAFWNINRKAGSIGKKYIHPAIYPNELVKRIILLTTKEGDVVVDPFLGSGTSLISSLECNRSFIGYEYNEGFKELMESRFNKELNPCIKIKYLNNN